MRLRLISLPKYLIDYWLNGFAPLKASRITIKFYFISARMNSSLEHAVSLNVMNGDGKEDDSDEEEKVHSAVFVAMWNGT